MRVLWVCNIMLPMIAEQLHMEAGNKEGWIAGLASAVLGGQRESGIEMAVAFPAPSGLTQAQGVRTHGESGICRGSLEAENGALSWYGFREDVVNPHIYAEDLERQMSEIAEDFRPDIVHCFGAEYPHTLAMCRAFPDKSRLLVGIQGICAAIADAYFADLPEKVIRSVTLRDILRRDSIVQQQKKFALRGRMERESLRLAGNITGRTAWDRQYARECSPAARYYEMNETLRPVFYEKEWRADQCEPHSIFVSQGDYPLKGLHYMLLALSEILAVYPDARVYVAGNSIVRYGSIGEKLKISAYGRYLRRLIRQGGLEGHVVFMGRLDAGQMLERYLKSHLFVCCSSLENSPNSLGEAMLLGMPCVSADVGGVSSIFTHGQDGLLYEGCKIQKNNTSNNDKKQLQLISDRLAEAVLDMWGDLEKQVQYCIHARKHAEKTHNRNVNYHRMMEIYSEIILRDKPEIIEQDGQ